MSRPIHKAVIYYALALSLAILAGIGFLSYRTLANLLASEGLKSHTFVVIEKLDALSSALMEAETARGGYILTKDASFLESCEEGAERTGRTLGEVRRLTADNPRQQERIERLAPLVRSKLANLEDSVALVGRTGDQLPVQSRYTREGKTLTDAIMALVGEMKEEERTLLDQQSADERRNIRRLETVTGCGAFGSILLILVSFQLLRREARNSSASARALRESEITLRALMDALNESAFLLAPEGRVLTLNETAARRIGKTVGEVVGTCVYDHFPPERAESRRRKVEEAVRTGRTVHFEDERGGMAFEGSIHPVTDGQGGANKVAVFAFDVTRQREAEGKLQEYSRVLERSNREIRLLSRMGELLQSCLSTEEAYEVIARFGGEFFPGDAGAVQILSASRNLVETVSWWGEELAGERVFHPEACWALRRGQPHPADGTEVSVRCGHVGARSGSYLCAPMMAQSETIGVLHLQFAPGVDAAAAEGKRQLALTMAEQISMALASLRLREKLRDLSIRDPVTGLLNRRFMEDALERELRRAHRKEMPMGVIMIDVDHFKRYNDTFGHDAGDTVLRELGRFFLENVRESDLACRYGGEEFTLILPEAGADVVYRRAERLKERARNLHLSHRGQPLGTITLSLGVALFPADGRTAEALLQEADAALYRAKKEGRDRVCLAPAGSDQICAGTSPTSS